MIEGTFTARKANEDPPSYRVWFDDGTGELAVGSISQRQNHITQLIRWHWGVDTFPLATGNPEGDVLTFGEAQSAFRTEFLRWVNNLPPGSWQRNRDHKKASSTRRHLDRP